MKYLLLLLIVVASFSCKKEKEKKLIYLAEIFPPELDPTDSFLTDQPCYTPGIYEISFIDENNNLVKKTSGSKFEYSFLPKSTSVDLFIEAFSCGCLGVETKILYGDELLASDDCEMLSFYQTQDTNYLGLPVSYYDTCYSSSKFKGAL